ncbi:MAG: HNH endonuclease family protein [Gemmataceae bacterium]
MNVTPKSHSVGQLTKAFAAGSLLRNPEYQRGETWSQLQKATFIDSVFRNYPVPALFFHRVETPGLDDEPSVKREIIDGQQRLTALRDFKAGVFPLLKMTGEPTLRLPKGVRELPAPWAGKTYAELDPLLQKDFEEKTITVFEVGSDAHPDEVRDLFIRLQSGTALTRQQIRDAWPGNLGPFVERLAGKLIKRPSLRLFGIIDKRGLRSDDEMRDKYVFDRQMCCQLLKVYLARTTDSFAYPSVSANQLDSMYHEYTDFDASGAMATSFVAILDTVADIFERVKGKLGKKAKFRRLDITVVLMYIQDVSKNPHFKLSLGSIEELAKNITAAESLTDKPTGKSTSGSTLKTYYTWWRQHAAKEAGIRLDTKRLFDEQDKQDIHNRDKGNCGICSKPVSDDEAEYDHFPIPYRDGGSTVVENGRLVHKVCHPRGRPAEDT